MDQPEGQILTRGRKKGWPLLSRRRVVAGLVIAAAGALAFSVFQWTRSPDPLEPTQDLSLLQKGLELHREQKYEEAIQEFTSVIKAQRDMPAAYLFRGIALSNAGQYDKSVSDFSKVLQLRPGYVVVYLYRGESYLAMGQGDMAAEDFAAVVRAAPEDKQLIVAAQAKLQAMGR